MNLFNLTLIWDSKIDHHASSLLESIYNSGEEPSAETLDLINEKFSEREYDFDEVLITSECLLLKNGEHVKVYLRNS